MSKIAALKEWLSYEDAAEYVSKELNEKVLPQDVLSLAINGTLPLSINLFTNKTIITSESIKYPLHDEEWTSDALEAVRTNQDIYFFSRNIAHTDVIGGVVDLLPTSIKGALSKFVHDLSKSNNDFFESDAMRYIEDKHVLLTDVVDNGSVSTFFNIGITYDDEQRALAKGLPDDSAFVVRVSAINEFLDTLNKPKKANENNPLTSNDEPEEKPLSTRERDTLLIIIAALAKEAEIDISMPSKAGGMIVATASAMGVSVSPRAVEEHLKKVPSALGKKSN